MVKVCECKKCCYECPPCLEPDSGPTEPDSGPTEPDASVPDASVPDASVPDASVPDASVPDASVPDASVPDASVPDASVPDASVPDASVPDASVPDASVSDATPVEPDAGVPDATPIEPDMEVVTEDGGTCKCPDGSTSQETDSGTEDDDLELIGGGGCAMSGGNAGLSSLGLVLALIFLVYFGIARKSKIFIIIGITFIALNVYADDYIITKGGKTNDHLQPTLGAMLDYKHRPAQIVRKSNGERVTDVVHHSTQLALSATLGFWNRLDVSLSVPIELSQGANGLNYLGYSYNESLDGGLGDMVFTPKLRLFTEDVFTLSLAAPIGFPTTTYDSVLGANAAFFTPTAIFDVETKYFSTALNVGYTFVGDQSVVFRSQRVVFDDSFTFSFGLKVPVWKDKFDFLGDAYVTVPVDGQDKEDVPAEFLGGLRFYLPAGFNVDIAAGGGVTPGVGAPEFRLLAGLSWTPQPAKEKIVHVPVYVEPKCPLCPTCKVCPKVKIVDKRIVISPVYFATDKDYVLPQSVPVLQDAVKVLKSNKWIKHVLVEGHCDWRASNKYNIDLARRRAEFVKKFLVKHGVEEDRLFAVVFGEESPADTNKTKDGMSRNRRVEFKITKPDVIESYKRCRENGVPDHKCLD
jgi:outer membrane protein OmpA-like peptidoglycan-associated protein